MAERSIKIFSFAEANALVPVVAEITSEVVQHLDTIRQRYHADPEKGELSVPEAVLKDVERVLEEWSSQIMELGAHPKGYFTVDFQSVDPELLYCWSYGEDRIEYTHKAWENFTHRRPLADSVDGPTNHLRWIN